MEGDRYGTSIAVIGHSLDRSLFGHLIAPTEIRVNMNIESICDQLRVKDQKLAEVIDVVGPCTLAPGRSAFDFLCDSILRQQLSKHSANAITQRFHELFDSGNPTPKQLLSLPKQDVLDAGVSNQKYGCLIDLANRIETRQLNFSTLLKKDDCTIRSLLKEVKGIGDWTVDMYLLFGLGRIDVFPVNDLALRKSMSALYGLDVKDLEGATKVAEKWKPYRSIASWYMYKHGDLQPQENQHLNVGGFVWIGISIDQLSEQRGR